MIGVKLFSYYLAAILPTILTFFILIWFFPYTGLGRIVALPMIFLVNSVILIIGFISTRNLKAAPLTMAWIGIILLTLVIAIVFYPQESGPSVIKQMIEKIRNH